MQQFLHNRTYNAGMCKYNLHYVLGVASICALLTHIASAFVTLQPFIERQMRARATNS